MPDFSRSVWDWRRQRAQVNYKSQRKVSVEKFGYWGDGDREMCKEEAPGEEQNSSEFTAKRLL